MPADSGYFSSIKPLNQGYHFLTKTFTLCGLNCKLFELICVDLFDECIPVCSVVSVEDFG